MFGFPDSRMAKLFPYFKWTVFGLLGINMALFFINQTAVEGIESLAWLVLLILFEWETSQLDKPYISSLERYSIHTGRILAYILDPLLCLRIHHFGVHQRKRTYRYVQCHHVAVDRFFT